MKSERINDSILTDAGELNQLIMSALNTADSHILINLIREIAATQKKPLFFYRKIFSACFDSPDVDIHKAVDFIKNLQAANVRYFDVATIGSFYFILAKNALNRADFNLLFAQYVLSAHEGKYSAELINEVVNAITVHEDLLNMLLNAMSTDARKNPFIKSLVLSAMNTSNVSVLQQINKHDPNLIEQVTGDLSAYDKHKIVLLMGVDNPEKGRFINSIMSQFASPLPLLETSGGLLTCAQILVNKGHIITVLKPGEFEEYLKTLARCQYPINEKFILADPHWKCGEINIDSHGQVSILILDSLGTKLDTPNSDIVDAIKAIHLQFPTAEIYVSKEKRQNSPKGCTIFSLDDACRLFSMEHYIDASYRQSGIFGYLRHENNILGTIKCPGAEHIAVQAVRIPLYLMRIMQSARFFTEVIPHRPQSEREMVLTKKQTTAEEVAKGKIGSNLVDDKVVNLRFSQKVKSMIKHNMAYIEQNTMEQINDDMRQCSLQGFQSRVHLTRGRRLVEVIEQALPATSNIVKSHQQS